MLLAREEEVGSNCRGHNPKLLVQPSSSTGKTSRTSFFLVFIARIAS